MYHPGDYKVICDGCGMTYLRSKCRKDWRGMIMCYPGCWEPRHPQDFVRGKPDITRVEEARPDVSYAIGETTVKTNAAVNATSIELTSVSTIKKYDGIGITMDDGVVHYSFLTADPAATTITINNYLPKAASAGNAVYLPSVSGVNFIATNEISGDDL